MLSFRTIALVYAVKVYVSPHYQEKMRAFGGVKVMAVQDEYDNTNTLKAAIRDLGFDIVLTCVPQELDGLCLSSGRVSWRHLRHGSDGLRARMVCRETPRGVSHWRKDPSWSDIVAATSALGMAG